MKKTLFILLFVLTGITSVSAQTKKNAYEDSVLCVVDGVKHRGVPKIDTNFIAEIMVYKDHDEALKQFGNEARNGVVIINTLSFEISEYQKRLSLFSNSYK
ncbi:hypothetical protein BDD43_2751 [Mucilaginibacter gracilis]|uniref:Uncharacterized protein n=1 Tax=Mucilaginibacter gracilis TaxID=423350 RepID=A0A495J0Q3_9SPHI|nr:hypothetical protein [Mucilaginibacter gracilis]RKR82566.1 hypothetical protein BDD43_2751 [Mucilaginibacter gracilis]